MAMGISSSSQYPLRPFCPYHFPFSFSRPLSMGSARALCRKEVYSIQSARCAFLSSTKFGYPHQFRNLCHHLWAPSHGEFIMKLQFDGSTNFPKMVPAEQEWHPSSQFFKGEPVINKKFFEGESFNHKNSESISGHKKVRGLEFQHSVAPENSFRFVDVYSWEREAHRVKNNRKMVQEALQCSSAYSSNQVCTDIRITNPPPDASDKDAAFAQHHGEGNLDSLGHSSRLRTCSTHIERNNVAGKQINGFSSERVPSTRKVSNNKLLQKGNSERKKDMETRESYVTLKRHDRYQEDLQRELARVYDKVLVIDDISVAEEVVRMLTTKYKHLVHACDTEVSCIDVKQETPVDHGEIICFSIYSGPKADFGNGKSCVWVDVLDGGGRDLLDKFAPFFSDPSIKKVWHNYSFDNHIIENYGIKLSGFHADTMHMARLWDSSRRSLGGYSLEALTGDEKVMCDSKLGEEKDLIGKMSMKTIFGRRKVKKNGSEGKIMTIAPVELLQREERKSWISYSALDAISTQKLYESLRFKLSRMSWIRDGIPTRKSMFDFYQEYWRPFGELLVKMETEGMLVDRAYLARLEKVARAEQEIAVNRFRNWASKYCPDAKYMNVGSDTQLRQLLFGGVVNSKNHNESLPTERIFKVPNIDEVIEEGKKSPSKYRSIKLCSLRHHDIELPAEKYTATGWPSVSGDALKALSGKVSVEYDFIDDPLDEEDGGSTSQSTDEASEKQLLTTDSDHDTSAYGKAYTAFGGGGRGREACHAIASLCEVCSIDSLISNFILPLQGSNVSGKNGRVHCSLNINTETGRLSARRPNLQNQPALEKDRYKIRQAFVAAPGNSLIVADYGQLELRILAHLADCESMLNAFKAGGDFHSRTAMNMYPHIREAIDEKKVLLEWHPQPGEDKPPVPLLKDAFASERRKAKMLNFSIAYGKTPVGLARDWKVSVEEAKRTVDLWYGDRKEVLDWQEARKKEALDPKKRYVLTLLGRARRFPLVTEAHRAQRGHIERAAINTPVQGSAADVAMCAMLEISRNKQLRELGWKLLLQVHDEVILEGPSESAEVAKAIVVKCMSKPFKGKNILKVDLSVDAKCAQNWYAAK